MSDERHHALDLFRGAAAIGIAIYHALDKHGVTIQSLGTFGVYLFFVLSALTMAIVYSDKFACGVAPGDAFNFYRNRMARILPLLALVAAASVLRNGISALEISQATLTATGLFSLSQPGMLSNAQGAWSLGIEIWFYLIAPIAIMLSANSTLRALILVTLLLLMAQQVFLFRIDGSTGRDHWQVYTVPLTFAPFFAAGFVIHKLGPSGDGWWPIVAVSGAAAIGCFSLVVPSDLVHSETLYLTLTCVAFVTVLGSYRTRLTARMIPAAGFLGDISYAMYLTHPLTLLAMGAIGGRLGLGLVMQTLIFIPAAIAVSYVTFRFFEKPARNRFRSGSGRRPDTPALG